jgi:hypothetical protein
MLARVIALVLVVFVVFGACAEAHAEEDRADALPFLDLHPFSLFLGVYVGPAWLDSANAGELGYAESGFKFGFSGGVIAFDLLHASLFAYGALPSDHKPFVMAGYDSAVNMAELGFAIGPRTPRLCFGGAAYGNCFSLFLFGNVGYSYIDTYRIVSLPSNTYCPDCEGEDLGDEWAWVLELGAGIGQPSRGWLGIELQPLWRVHPGSAFCNHDLQLGIVGTFL